MCAAQPLQDARLIVGERRDVEDDHADGLIFGEHQRVTIARGAADVEAVAAQATFEYPNHRRVTFHKKDPHRWGRVYECGS